MRGREMKRGRDEDEKNEREKKRDADGGVKDHRR